MKMFLLFVALGIAFWAVSDWVYGVTPNWPQRFALSAVISAFHLHGRCWPLKQAARPQGLPPKED